MDDTDADSPQIASGSTRRRPLRHSRQPQQRLIRTGIAIDTFTLLEAIAKSGVPNKQATIEGTFPMQDKFGNPVDDAVVFTAVVTHDYAKQINYADPTVTAWDNLPSLTKTGSCFSTRHSVSDQEISLLSQMAAPVAVRAPGTPSPAEQG